MSHTPFNTAEKIIHSIWDYHKRDSPQDYHCLCETFQNAIKRLGNELDKSTKSIAILEQTIRTLEDENFNLKQKLENNNSSKTIKKKQQYSKNNDRIKSLRPRKPINYKY